MTTSERKSTKQLAHAMPVLARGVSFGDETLVVSLEDGRQISVPITWFPRLATALAAHSGELDNWRLIGGGIGIHWPDLDEDVSVENLLANRAVLLTYHDVPSDLDGQHRRAAQKTMDERTQRRQGNRAQLGARASLSAEGASEPPATQPESD